MAGPETLSYCAQQLRRHDPDRYLTGLFAPAARREDLFALYAFNLELAKTAEVVSEPMLGQIRLQWWRESLDRTYQGGPRQHEMIPPLAEAVERHGLTRGHFERLIEGRAFDLEPDPPENIARLTAYAEDSSSSLVLLALEVLGVSEAAAREAGRQVGIAWALVGVLRAVPFHARQQRLYLPQDRLEDAGVDLGYVYALKGSPELSRVVGEVAAVAKEHLSAARALRPQVPRRALPALLPGRLASRYLAQLERAGHDPFHQAVQSALPGRVWGLAWARLLGCY
ncbi:MAG: squalene/phytoene synthase family protein [Rhodospirillales bacterium]|nr:squalene/phytoene synthase family protein [Rhodospirillales bacterium]